MDKVHDVKDRKRCRRLKAFFAAAMLGVVAVSGYAYIAEPVIVHGETTAKTGRVTPNTTNVNIRTAPDTSDRNNIITKVNTGFCFDILGVTYTSGTYKWYNIGFYLNGQYRTGYIAGEFVVEDAASGDDGYNSDGDFEAYLNAQKFPESYKQGLREVHAKYPNWVFIADYTGKDWNTVVENQNALGRSLIYGSAKSSWKSTSERDYNYETGQWYERDSGGWVQASSELVQYALDPRNFLNETNIFMFESLGYNGSLQTESGVKNVISNSFMASSNHDLSFNGTRYTYSSGLMLAGKQSRVSPYHLATRIIQEQGVNGTGRSISGTVNRFPGIYNYYNQGAYKTTTLDAVENGLRFSSLNDSATMRPWDTRMKSIVGGAIYLGSKYINRGQDTLYYEKFDLISPYTHQYMTNILAPRSESQTAAKAYSESIKKNTALVFKIPVYNNMPASACPIPTGDGSPNNALKSLSVDGFGLTPTFGMFTTSYDLIVENNVSSINISAQTADSSARVNGAGRHNLNVGNNKINVNVTAANGKTKTYTLNVVRKTASGGSSGDSGGSGTGFTCDYRVDEAASTVSQVGVGSNASDVLSGIKCSNSMSAKIVKADGSENTGKVGTGNKLIIKNGSGNTVKEYTFIIYGDLNGDGEVDVFDLMKMRKHLLDISHLSGPYLTAADTNRKNDGINVYDLMYLRRHLLDISYISQ